MNPRGLATGACLTVLLLGAACDRPRPTVEIVTGQWPPYTAEEAEGQGALTETMSVAFNSIGYRPRYRFVPFHGAKDLAKNRRVAGTFPWFVTDAVKEDWIVVEEPLLHVEYVFFTRLDSLERRHIDPRTVASLSDLEGLVFGGVEGYTYPDDVRRRIEDHQYTTEPQAFRALLGRGQDRVDVVPASREVGLHLITGPLAAADVEIVLLDRGSLSLTQPVYFLVNPGYPGAERFARELAAELRRLRRTGFQSGAQDPDLDSRHVSLTGPPDMLGVPAYRRRADADPEWRIPHGSPAVVVRWADAFEARILETSGDVPAHRCRVRLLEGPGRGRLVWVSGMYVQRDRGGAAP